MKILVVDDDLDLLSLMKITLIKSGYLVTTLNNSKNNLSVVDSFLPNLIILDINLGDADGRDLCRQIKSLERYHHLPILLYSAEVFPGFKITDCNATAFMQKPFSSSEFLQIIIQLLPG